MKKFYFLFSLLFFSFFDGQSQTFSDTLNIVQYNILRYGSPGISCTPLSTTAKNPYLKTFVDYELPDILGINEIGFAQTNVTSFLDNVLNTSGRTNYKAATMVDNGSLSSDNIQDLVFYNSAKLRLVSQSVIDCSPRDFFLYNFKHKNPTGDSATITVILGHLKSSDGTTDRSTRGDCATNIMSHLAANYNKTGNYFVMGDFNLYKTTEAAYVNFTTNANKKINFMDPLYAVITTGVGKNFYNGNNASIPTGTSNNNSSFAPYHTQAAQATQLNCGSGGGMDDRFDYIFCNRSVLDDSAQVNYIPNTYKVAGNDGLHFNKSINDTPENTSAPANVITALYNISDHLPVSMKVKVSVSISGVANPSITFDGFTLTVGGTNVNIYSQFITNSSGSKSFEITGDAASIINDNIVAQKAGTITITGKVGKVFGFNAGEKTIVVNVLPKLIDPNFVQGRFTTNISQISIFGEIRTISGTYTFASEGTGFTVSGVSTSISGDTFNGVFIGNQTISGNNISFLIKESLSIPTNVKILNANSGLKVNIVANCLFVKAEKDQTLQAAIFDISGKCIWKETLANGDTRCTIPNLGSGVYLLKVQGISGEPQYIQKLFVE